MVRRRQGRGFSYTDPQGRRVADPEVLARIRGLALPPAWTDVWICVDEAGHLQAAGSAAATRLGSARTTPPRTGRLGSRRSARSTSPWAGDRASFDFVAKFGVRQVREVGDPQILPVLRALKRRRDGGQELLAWRDADRWVDLRSSDVNAYLKEIAGEEFSAKDFRTWHGTVLAAVALAGGERPTSPTAAKRAVSTAVKEVAAQLGNTPAVCRASYVDPRVIDRFTEGAVADLPREVALEPLHPTIEAKVLDLLQGTQPHTGAGAGAAAPPSHVTQTRATYDLGTRTSGPNPWHMAAAMPSTRAGRRRWRLSTDGEAGLNVCSKHRFGVKP